MNTGLVDIMRLWQDASSAITTLKAEKPADFNSLVIVEAAEVVAHGFARRWVSEYAYPLVIIAGVDCRPTGGFLFSSSDFAAKMLTDRLNGCGWRDVLVVHLP